jgi:ribonuclease P protein component
VKRRFRLTRSTDFKRVRTEGKSYSHPLVVLVASAAEQTELRVGVSTGYALGGAVQRNRARRLLREAVRPLVEQMPSGWEIVLIARKPLLGAGFLEIKAAVQGLFLRAGLGIQEQ